MRSARHRLGRAALGLCAITLVLEAAAPRPQATPPPAAAGAAARAKADAQASARAVIYPRGPQIVRFDHARHAQLACARCHAEIPRSRRAADSHTPGMDACVGCHDGQTASPSLQECAGCHVGYAVFAPLERATPEAWRAVRPAPMIPPRPQAHLKFAHARHARMKCASCHGPDGDGQPSMPSMASCTSCHDGQRAAAECATCHVRAVGDAGRLQTAFDTPMAHERRAYLKPDDHTEDWLRRHGGVFRASPNECMSCHQESSCNDCHDDKSGQLLSVHPPNYVVLHRVAAQGQRANCVECHRQETTCTSCHIRSRASTRPGGQPPPRRAFHPPGWLDLSNPSSHGPMARRNINECASCHQERDCVSCHQGVNPHPPTFRMDCRRWLRANPRPCYACHTDPQSICP